MSLEDAFMVDNVVSLTYCLGKKILGIVKMKSLIVAFCKGFKKGLSPYISTKQFKYFIMNFKNEEKEAIIKIIEFMKKYNVSFQDEQNYYSVSMIFRDSNNSVVIDDVSCLENILKN